MRTMAVKLALFELAIFAAWVAECYLLADAIPRASWCREHRADGGHLHQQKTSARSPAGTCCA
jgi:hypothetical protein